MREKALDDGGEVIVGKVGDSLRFGAYFAQPTGTESKRRLVPHNETTSQSRKGKIEMKVAVTAQGKELSSETDLRFGRAQWLIVVNTETGDYEAHDNIANLNTAQGAGIQAGQNIANLGVEAVITGNVGPNAFKTLNAAGVKIFLAQKQTVQEALESFKAGKLEEVNQANVEGHWI